MTRLASSVGYALALASALYACGDERPGDDGRVIATVGAGSTVATTGGSASGPFSACNTTPVLSCEDPGESCICSGFDCVGAPAKVDEACVITCSEAYEWEARCGPGAGGGGLGGNGSVGGAGGA